jgi:RNA polymerase sigma-70 factor (ECF subfamily)
MPERFASPEVGASLSPTTKGKLAALPETFRAVLELVDLAELTYREAATELGVPVGTVMSRLHRGRKLLASQMVEIELAPLAA